MVCHITHLYFYIYQLSPAAVVNCMGACVRTWLVRACLTTVNNAQCCVVLRPTGSKLVARLQQLQLSRVQRAAGGRARAIEVWIIIMVWILFVYCVWYGERGKQIKIIIISSSSRSSISQIIKHTTKTTTTTTTLSPLPSFFLYRR
jgi:hypothetical protein